MLHDQFSGSAKGIPRSTTRVLHLDGLHLNLAVLVKLSNPKNTGDILRPTGAAGREWRHKSTAPLFVLRPSKTPAIGLNRRHRVLWRSISVTFAIPSFPQAKFSQ